MVTTRKTSRKEKYVENIMKNKYPNGREAHRAMYSIEEAIELLKLFKSYLATF
jgi:hypothetical protein